MPHGASCPAHPGNPTDPQETLLMTTNRTILLTAAAGAVLILLRPAAMADDGTVLLQAQGQQTVIQIEGDEDDDWQIQGSDDLVTWATLTNLGTILSGDPSFASVTDGEPAGTVRFYRALRTDGLYDTTFLRTVSLTFTQANWQSLLTSGRTTGSNTLGTLILNNGYTNTGIGARYRGNTSFTGIGGSSAPTKKSLNIELDFGEPTADLMGYDTVNLNNAFGDETIFREALYFNVMRRYAVCPRACLAQLYINGTNWGVYSFVQQQDDDLIKEWFPSNDGDRWRAPNMAGMGGPGSSSASGALGYLGTNVSSYKSVYELKAGDATNAWQRLIHATYVLNNTATNLLRDEVENVLAVDRWLWFLALENLFADDDSYFNKGADYMFYYEPESGRIHPVEHDGNESFVAGDVSLSPVSGATASDRPVLRRLLSIPELRQRYLAHYRTALHESFHPDAILPRIEEFRALSIDAVMADPKKNYTMLSYTNDLNSLKTWVQRRYTNLLSNTELRVVGPTIVTVTGPGTPPTAAQTAVITAQVEPNGSDGIDSVWLYHRGQSYGRFTTTQMFDDGTHTDGAANDGVYGATITAYPAGTKVRYYVEARSANTARTAVFSPARAEEDTDNYRVANTQAGSTPVVINEFMASNSTVVADPQGEYDDWIELRNLTDQTVDLTGHYLSDEPNNPRKWMFPDGTAIPANGYLLVWADEDGSTVPGLHASFKLSASGEELFLTDTDANLNVVLDSILFGEQETDRSYGRPAADPNVWSILDPTPGTPNP